MWQKVDRVEAIREVTREFVRKAETPMRILIDPTEPGIAWGSTSPRDPETAALPLLLELTSAEYDVVADDAAIRVRHLAGSIGASPETPPGTGEKRIRGEAAVVVTSFPWESVFCAASATVRGPKGDTAVLKVFRDEAIPEVVRRLDPQARAPQEGLPSLGLVLLVAVCGIDRSSIAELQPFQMALPEEWLAEVKRDGRLMPDKRVALETLLDKAFPRPVLVLLDGKYPGVQLPPSLAGSPAVAMQVGRRAPFEDLRVTGVHVRFRLHDGGARHTVVLPWGAVCGMQDPMMLDGWFWPADVPAAARTPITEHPKEFAHLRGQRGVPFVSSTDILPDGVHYQRFLLAPEANPRDAVAKALLRPGAMVFVDPTKPRVDVAPEHRTQPYVAVPLFVAGELGGRYELDPRINGLEARVNMPDPAGGIRTVSFPWDAVFAVTETGALRISHYPVNWPERLWEAARVRRHLEDFGRLPDDLPEGFESGSPGGEQKFEFGTVYIGQTPDGRAVLAMQQPMGPVESGGVRPALELVIALDEFPAAVSA